MLLLIVKLVGVAASLFFGAYGIGHNTRSNVDGSLTRVGKITLVGLLLSSLITFSVQVIDERERANIVKAEAQRYERLLRAQYSILSTAGARLDLKASISIDSMRSIEPDYAKRLELARTDTQHCKGTSILFPATQRE